MKKLTKTKSLLVLTTFLSVSLSSILFSAAFAQTTLPNYTAMPDRETGTVVSASPTLLGLGQQTLINIFTYPAPAGPTYYSPLFQGSLQGFSNTSITITKPDGSQDTFMPIDFTLQQIGIEVAGQQQIVGSLMFYYEPDQVGEYSLEASFAGQFYTIESLSLSVYYKPSETKEPATFTVQQEIVDQSGLLTGWPWSPLPENYWEEPVSIDNREWAAISGDWLMASPLGIGIFDAQYTGYNPYSTAPESCHIIWSKQVGIGGLPGGVWGSLPYEGQTFLTASYPSVVLEGKIYQNSNNPNYFECIDLRTGEQLWDAPGSITHAQRQLPFFQTESQQNQGGINAYLWDAAAGDTQWTIYDPFDGHTLQVIENVPYDLSAVHFQEADPTVFCAQSFPYGSPGFNFTTMKLEYANLIKWDYTKVVGNDWSTGIVWNVSIMQTDLISSIGDNGFRGVNLWLFPEADVVVVKTPNAQQIMAGYSYSTGEFLWRNTETVLDIAIMTGIATSKSGPLFMHDGATQTLVAYDITNGQELYRAPQGDLPWGIIPCYTYAYNNQNGNFYYGSYDGHVYAIDIETGEPIWTSEYYGDITETIYETQPFSAGLIGADGVLFTSACNAYANMPRVRFFSLVAIDEVTGEYLWKLPIAAEPKAIADGYLVASDGENGMLYCIGKGQTVTTIETTKTAVPLGTSVTLLGSVTDQSTGAPNTPAISEEGMSEWMDYLYGQNATLINTPPTPEGVQVKLEAIDPNGNYQYVGTTTSNSEGNYGFSYVPEIPGLYTIRATFEGSASYYGSTTTTYLTVDSAPSTSTPIDTLEPETSSEPTPETPFVTTEVVIIGILALIVGLSAYFLLKRK